MGLGPGPPRDHLSPGARAGAGGCGRLRVAGRSVPCDPARDDEPTDTSAGRPARRPALHGAARVSGVPDEAPRGAAAGRGIGWVPYLVLCGIGLTVGLAWIGPRAAEGLGTAGALAFWAAHVFPALGLLAATQMALARVAALSALPGIVQVALSAVAASLLFTPLALGIDALFDAEGSRDDAAIPLPLRAASEFAQFVVPFVLTWVLINAPSLMKLEAAGAPVPSGPDLPDAPGPSGEAEFRARIPGRLGRDIVALSAELHYLRVYTTRGDTLILFPFGRAVEVLRDARGMQVHRSHWVALDHVDALVTREGRLFCDMVRGPSLPVSRSCRAALRAALRSA